MAICPSRRSSLPESERPGAQHARKNEVLLIFGRNHFKWKGFAQILSPGVSSLHLEFLPNPIPLTLFDAFKLVIELMSCDSLTGSLLYPISFSILVTVL